ncbi:hypothetical protein BKA63DRAFT_418090 [Paraphoma chrysanthemicola]|nr:hypothetical protein BKA63DRAFT_418090 [Paraphoma chrysanthemicola]
MSASSLPAVSHTKSIHLLRALLREATYLPDAVARRYFRTYIVDRFRAYQPKQHGTIALDQYRHRSFKRRQLSIITERASALQKKAQKGLYYLRRANQGELPCLQKVLYFAYGRIGKRKHALLHELVKPNPVMDGDRVIAPLDFDGPTPLQELYFSSKQYLQYFDAPKPASGTHHTPMHNIWMRPMPVVRARNNVRRWYAETMTRLLPPLPSEEWDHMHAMICGHQKVSLVERRILAVSEHGTQTSGVDAIAEGMRLDKLSKADRPAGMWRPHTITPRYMKRMYSKLLRLCCKVEYNNERKQWAATWGEVVRPISPKIYQPSYDENLFAGVDSHGRITRPAKERKPADEVQRSLQPRDAKGDYVHFPFYVDLLPNSHPLRKELEAWKKKRRSAGIVDENGAFRGR